MRNLVRGCPPQRARVIAVASGKGGVGKTNIVVNLGLILSRQGKKILILDADLGLANVDILLGLLPRYNLLDVLNGQCNLQEVIVRGPHNLLLIPGVSGFEKLAELDHFSRNQLMKELATLAKEVDIILIDSGAGISRTVLSFAAAAGEAIVVSTPEPTAIADAYCLIKALQRLNVSMYLLVNRAASDADGMITARRLRGACHRFLQLDLPLLGIIPDDRHVSEAVRKQQPYSAIYPRCRAAKALQEAAARLQGQDLPFIGPKNFWQCLERLFGR
ncbi:MAG: MinD/ParA family protein [Clostridia bacterium]|nr:MinD/ParA family protein [Clostridia bacterium]